MSDYHCDDKDVLVAFLYGELGADERRDVEAHLGTCRACADEVEGLSGVRQELAAWMPPEPDLGFTIVQKTPPASPRWWPRAVPAWAQAAAAVLVLAIGAAIANLQVRYAADGLTVSTGWSRAAAAPAAPRTAGAPAAASTASQDWRAAFEALERDMRREMESMRHTEPPPVTPAAYEESGGSSNAALLRQVRGLIEESERRQQRELAIRLTQFGRDVEVQRRADLVRIEQGVGQLQGRTDAQVARQREVLNYLVRVSGRPVVPQ